VTLDEMLERIGADGQRKTAAALASSLDAAAPADWRNLAALLASRDLPPIVGLSGGQGAGKSTLARLLVTARRLAGHSCAGCSLDDFYLSRGDRQRLARDVHPLLVTRGVPGTHDVGLALATLARLGREKTALVPVFDKGSDDLLPRSRWNSVAGPISTVVFEGWCVGARPQPEALLASPVNGFEAAEDADGRWRSYVNRALATDYQQLWERVDFLVYLQVPDFEAVKRWRTRQEQQLPPEQRMDEAILDRFLAHYERLTRWMLETLPDRAELVVRLAADHTIASIHAA